MTIDIKEFGANLGNREYWDSCGAEWNYSTIEQKIFKLAEFVQAGGNLYPVIYKYAKGREYTYRRAINWCILDYLNTLMVEGYYVNFMLLDNKEAVKLLSELLKVGAERKLKSKRIDSRFYDYYEWELKKVEDESILVAIEEEHKRKHPDETLEDQQKWIKFWKEESLW